MNNLALVLLDRGELEEARALFSRALFSTEAAYGPDHPHTRKVRDSLEWLDR